MKVLAIKRNLRGLRDDSYILPDTGDEEGEIPERIYPPAALHSFLRECDYVALTVPLTPNTHHLIDAAALAAMRGDAVLINVSRGRIVNEKALAEALHNGVIAGAALDVFEEEPLSSESPLWEIPNLIISPHVSGFTPEYNARAADLFVDNLIRYLNGEELMNVVDRRLGY
jgi:phosphoglycerate dehydrogenase-like enzyme